MEALIIQQILAKLGSAATLAEVETVLADVAAAIPAIRKLFPADKPGVDLQDAAPEAKP